MKYRIWIRNVAAISCLWSAPLLFLGSCTENVLETKADNGEDALVEIVPGVRADGEDSENGSSSSNTGGNAVVSGPVDNSDLMNLPFWFARGEESRGCRPELQRCQAAAASPERIVRPFCVPYFQDPRALAARRFPQKTAVPESGTAL